MINANGGQERRPSIQEGRKREHAAHRQRSRVCRSHTESDRGDPGRRGTLCKIRVEEAPHDVPGGVNESSRQKPSTARAKRATLVGGVWHPSSAF